MTMAKNEAARRLGIPVCEVCSEPDCKPRREWLKQNVVLLNALLCDRCYVDWLRREVQREMREEERRRQLDLMTASAQAYALPEWAR